MNQISDLPNETFYGHDFNYAQWTASTQVSLHNVTWDGAYQDVVYFNGGHKTLDAFLETQSGPSVRIPSMTYHRPGQPIRINIPYGRALEFNYLRAYNPPQPGQPDDIGRSYYYFIGGVNHINPSTTEFVLQLDVWQSYIYRLTFGNCFIERSHAGIANANRWYNYGRDYLTIPEGLDMGSDYQIQARYSRAIASARNGDIGYSIMVVSTVALDEEPGDVKNPKLKTAEGSSLENLPNGAEVYVFQDRVKFFEFLAAYQDKPWITQGIISITPIPRDLAVEYGMRSEAKQVAGVTIMQPKQGKLKTLTTTVAQGWREAIRNTLPQRYRHLDKFLTSPFTMVELTANTGTPIALKPESMPSDDIKIVEVPHFAQPGPRIMFYPYRYNAGEGSPAQNDENGVYNDGGEFLDMATGIFNFPTFSLVNNSYLSYMASNANSIAFQHSSADWSQQRALAGNDLAAHQATANIGLSQQLTGIGIDTNRQQTTLNQQTTAMRGALGGINGVLGSATPGQAIGAAANAIAGTAIDLNQQEQSYGINTRSARAINATNTGNAGYMRDTNKDYSDWATRGDYQTAIAGIEAKVQDAQLIQPTTSGQVGGDGFLISQYHLGYDVKVKTLQPGAIARYGEYWLRYGYAVHRFGSMPADFQAMSKFTYWKLLETYIVSGSCPESFKNTIRGIFEKGVTVWSDPNEIGRIDMAVNRPLDRIYL